MRHLPRLLAAFAAFALAACYNSDTPLLTPAEADYPFPARVEYTHIGIGGVEALGTLLHEGNHYVRSQPGQNAALMFLFQHIEGEYYLVQETDPDLGTANYDVVRITPSAVYLSSLRCSEIFDASSIASGAFSSAHTEFGFTCKATDLETIRAALSARMTSAMAQESFLILGSSE